jgi:hypothetical protein
MPFVNAKCPIAVNTNITAIAILPDKRQSYFLENIFVTIKLIENAPSNTNKGTIFYSL